MSSNTCLSGDEWGTYTFDYPLEIGDKIVFNDAISYSFVKSSYFNGVMHPSIYTKNGDDYTLVKQFGYEDFRNKLG